MPSVQAPCATPGSSCSSTEPRAVGVGSTQLGRRVEDDPSDGTMRGQGSARPPVADSPRPRAGAPRGSVRRDALAAAAVQAAEMGCGEPVAIWRTFTPKNKTKLNRSYQTQETRSSFGRNPDRQSSINISVLSQSINCTNGTECTNIAIKVRTHHGKYRGNICKRRGG